MYSFIHLFIYSFIHSFIYLFIYLFIYSFIHLFIHLFIYLFIIYVVLTNFGLTFLKSISQYLTVYLRISGIDARRFLVWSLTHDVI